MRSLKAKPPSSFFLKSFKLHAEPYLWCLPALLLVAVTAFYPIIYSFYLSLTNYKFGTVDVKIVGLDNYVKALISGDYLEALRITLAFISVSVAIELFFGLGAALLLNSITKGTRAVKALITLPITITPLAAGLMWKWILEPEVGIANYFLTLLGLPKQMWLGIPALAFWAIVFTDIWRQTPFVIIVLLAGLSAIPSNLYEAAVIDGAGSWITFRHITLPYLRPALFVILLSLTATAFKVFDTVYILTHGGPASATEVLSFLIYRTGFKFSQLAYASALSYLMLIISLVISVLYLVIVYPREHL
jgi:multiple sugar transport system permease protein